MQLVIAILLKSVFISAILFGYYLLLLRNRPMHRYNRFYLLGSVIASIVIPFQHFEWYNISATAVAPMSKIFEIVNSGGQEEDIVIRTTSIFTLSNALWALYTLVAMGLLVRSIASLVKIYRVRARAKSEKIGMINIIHTELESAPFSFMNNIFWNDGVSLYSREGSRILKHETVHVEQRHTYDKLLLQLACAIYWINPIYWLMRKELSMVHEFLADGTAIEDGDTDAFATMLLYSHFGVTRHTVVNSFYFSPIKRRLTMLTNTSSTRFLRSRKLGALPLAVAALGLFSFTVRKTTVATANHRIVVMLDAGHGGMDAGGRSSDGLYEKDLALQLTMRLAQLAPEYNIAVLQTRNSDNYVTLNNRTEASNNSNADVYVSVHLNKAEAGSKGGNDYAVYVSERNAQYANSKTLATQVANSLATIGITPEIVNKKGLLVLQGNKRAAILVECGNIDDAEDMARLTDPRRMDELCRTLLSGVVAYANGKK